MANIEQETVCALPAPLANCSIPLAAFPEIDELGASLVFISRQKGHRRSFTAQQQISQFLTHVRHLPEITPKKYNIVEAKFLFTMC